MVELIVSSASSESAESKLDTVYCTLPAPNTICVTLDLWYPSFITPNHPVPLRHGELTILLSPLTSQSTASVTQNRLALGSTRVHTWRVSEATKAPARRSTRLMVLDPHFNPNSCLIPCRVIRRFFLVVETILRWIRSGNICRFPDPGFLDTRPLMITFRSPSLVRNIPLAAKIR